MPYIIYKKVFLGLATCKKGGRPWWKVWIKIYGIYSRHNKTGVEQAFNVCNDCKCPCDNFEIWLPVIRRRAAPVKIGRLGRENEHQRNHRKISQGQWL